METGQKITPQKNNIDELSPYILSIQVNLNGLSFCVLNKDNNILSFFRDICFEQKQTAAELLNRMSQEFTSESQLQGPFHSVKVIYDNELSVLVPAPLFYY